MYALRRQWIRGGAIAVVLAVLVTACGGGGGASSSTPSAGTGKAMSITGVITGFGSVIVNGQHFESDAATVTLEGKPGAVGDLKVGEVVHLEATQDAQGNMHASVINQGRLIQGAVTAVDAAGGTLTVEGQLVIVDNETSFDNSIPTRSLAGIVVGDRVEVHGFVGADGTAHATRIEKADASDPEIEVTGPISALDTTTMRFSIGAQVVDYQTATLRGFPTSGPAEGDIVEVQGTTLLSDGALKADRVSREDGNLEGQQGDGAELEGMVTSFTSATDFEVSGHKVTTTATTVYVGGSSTDLALNAMVEVEGTLDASSTLVAAKVSFRHEGSVRLGANVEAVDTTAGTLTVLGVTIIVTPDTRKEDNEANEHFFALADVQVGDRVEVSAYPDPAGSGKLVATRLERDNPEDFVKLRGPAVDLNLAAPTGTFTIAGVGIETTADTSFEGSGASLSAADFYAQAIGQVVDVRGTWNGTTPLIASKAEIVRASGDHSE